MKEAPRFLPPKDVQRIIESVAEGAKTVVKPLLETKIVIPADKLPGMSLTINIALKTT